MVSGIAGALAGAITGVATTPLDVVKTRLMTQGTNKVYSGVLDCVRKIWQEETPAAFLRVSPHLLRRPSSVQQQQQQLI